MRLKVDASVLSSLSPSERREVEQQLHALEELRRQNPLLFFRPHEKQVTFLSSREPLKAFLGGNRSGKTTAAQVDLLLQAIDRSVVPDHLAGFKRWEPPFFARVVTPDLTNTLDGVVLQKIRDWCPPSQFRGGSFDRAWSEKSRILSFKNGSWVQFFSNDQDLDKFGGAALHACYYDEEPRQDIRKESLMRLIDFGGEEIFAMTPLQGMSWMFTDVYEPWERGELRDATIVTVDMDDNPHLDSRTKDRVLSGLSREEKAARKSGRFVHFAGLIYPEFSPSRHVIPQLAVIPADPLVLLGGIDNGISNMAGMLLAFLDSDDVLTVFDELPLQGHTVNRAASAYLNRWESWGASPRWTIIDPASRRTEEQTGKSIRDAYRESGVFTLLGINDRLAGINAVKERLETDRLMVTANCVELIREFKRYRWKAAASRSQEDARETPLRVDDHELDALRYVCMCPMVKPRVREERSDTLADRVLRESLKHLRSTPAHPGGPGIFA